MANYKHICNFCHSCGIPGPHDHTLRTYSNGNSSVSCPKLLNTECQNCKKLGHTKYYCPNPTNSNSDANTNSNSDANTNSDLVFYVNKTQNSDTKTFHSRSSSPDSDTPLNKLWRKNDNNSVSIAKLSAGMASIDVSQSSDTSPTKTYSFILQKSSIPSAKPKPTTPLVKPKPPSGLTKQQHIENLRLKLNGTQTACWASDSDDE